MTANRHHSPKPQAAPGFVPNRRPKLTGRLAWGIGASQGWGMTNKYDASLLNDAQKTHFIQGWLECMGHTEWDSLSGEEVRRAARVPTPPTAAELEKRLADEALAQYTDPHTRWVAPSLELLSDLYHARKREAGE